MAVRASRLTDEHTIPPKDGAMLMRCNFCRVERVILIWKKGLGWCCPNCGTNMEGERHVPLSANR